MSQLESARLISEYEQLSSLTTEMRAAAERGDWDDLLGIEARRSQLLESVKTRDVSLKLDTASHHRRRELALQMLAHDEAIRDLVKMQLNELQVKIGSTQNTQRLMRAYGG